MLRLATVERAVAHLIAGWVAKVPELDTKLALAAGLEGHLARAAALRNQALALLERDDDGLTACPGWVVPLRDLDAHISSALMTAAVGGPVRRFLSDRYADLASRLDPLVDARLLAIVSAAVAAFDDLGPSDGVLERRLDEAWADEATTRVPLDDVLWGPTDRVPFPARPVGRSRPPAGTRGHFGWNSRLLEDEIAAS